MRTDAPAIPTSFSGHGTWDKKPRVSWRSTTLNGPVVFLINLFQLFYSFAFCSECIIYIPDLRQCFGSERDVSKDANLVPCRHILTVFHPQFCLASRVRAEPKHLASHSLFQLHGLRFTEQKAKSRCKRTEQCKSKCKCEVRQHGWMLLLSVGLRQRIRIELFQTYFHTANM